jgi:hypothetical protein
MDHAYRTGVKTPGLTAHSFSNRLLQGTKLHVQFISALEMRPTGEIYQQSGNWAELRVVITTSRFLSWNQEGFHLSDRNRFGICSWMCYVLGIWLDSKWLDGEQ